MATTRQRQAYITAIRRLIGSGNQLEGEALGRAFGLLQGAEGRIRESLLAGGSEWNVARLNRLKMQVGEVMGDFGARYGEAFRGFEGRAWELGAGVVEEGMGALGVEMGYWPILTRTQLEILQGFSADLITNLGQDAIRRITGVLVRGAMTELGPFEVMEEITRLLGMVGATWTGPWRATGVLYRAELIARTELLRTFSLGTEVRVQQAADVVEGLGKRWVATGDSRTRPTHLAAHGQVVAAKGGKFRVGGWECDYPRDPALPPEESCNCRCRHLPWLPEFEEDWGELDERVRGLLKKPIRPGK